VTIITFCKLTCSPDEEMCGFADVRALTVEQGLAQAGVPVQKQQEEHSCENREYRYDYYGLEV
jgi:hypothetical protein